MIYPSGRVIGHSLRGRFSKLLQYAPENFRHTQERMNRSILSEVKFFKKSRPKSVNNGSFTIKLVSNAFAKLLPDKTLSSLTNFLPEELNVEGQWEVAVSEKSYLLRYQNVTQRKSMFFHKKTFNYF